MESQQSNRTIRRFVFGLVVLFCSVGAFGLNSEPDARVLLNADRYVVGSRWTLDIIADSSDPLSVKVSVPSWPQSVSLLDGPYIRESTWEREPGTLTRATKATFTLRALKPGIEELGPFTVTMGTKIIVLPAITVYFLAADEASRRYPVELAWKIPDGTLYEGQAIPMVLMAKNLDNLTQPVDPDLSAPAGSLWERAVGLGDIEINSIGEDRLMNIPWGGWMLIPTKPGTLTIPGFRGSVYGLTRAVPALTLPVQALPPEVSGTRAVGVFTYNIDAKLGTGTSAGQVVVTQELTGRGNFPYLVLPDVVLSGLTLVSRQEATHYRAAMGGYDGSLVVTWRFSTDKTKTIVANLPGFISFQSQTGRIDRWDPRQASLTVSLAADLVPRVQAAARKPLDWAQVVAARPWAVASPFWFFLSLAPGVLLWGLSFINRRPRWGLFVFLLSGVLFFSAIPEPPVGFAAAFQSAAPESSDLWQSLALAHPDEPGLWYNAGLAFRDSQRVAEAVHALRTAIYDGFQGPEASSELMALEEKVLLTDQFQPWNGPSMSWILLVLSLSINLWFVFWAFQRWTKSTRWLAPMALAGVLILIATGVGLAAEQARRAADAVIGTSDCAIHKVPGDLAETWMTLKAGTVVKILGNSNEWDLVRTGYGLEGWVDRKAILLLRRP